MSTESNNQVSDKPSLLESGLLSHKQGKDKRVLIMIGVAIASALIYTGAQAHINSKAEEKINQVISSWQAIGAEVDYGDISVGLMAGDVAVSDIAIKGDGKKISVDEFIIHSIDEESSIPSFINASVNGINVNTDTLELAQQKYLEALGYAGEISTNMGLDYHYDKVNKTFKLNGLFIGADDVGELSATLELANVNFDPGNPFMLLMSYHTINLVSAEFSFEEDSLVSRIFNRDAYRANRTEIEHKERFFESLDKEIARARTDFTRDAMTEFRKFVADPDEITISIKPDAPISLREIERLKSPEDMVKKLGMKVSS